MAAPTSEASGLVLAMTLAATAGWVDAIGYLHFAGLFVSFMSGNSTIFGVAVGRGDWDAIVAPSLAVASFVLGSFLGALIGAGKGPVRLAAILAFEAALLGVALGLFLSGPDLPFATVTLATAMGAQNAALQRVGNATVGLTYVTGALVKLGQSLADAVLRHAHAGSGWIHASLWGALVAGAVAGTAAYDTYGPPALAAPTAVVMLISAVTAVRVLYVVIRRRFKHRAAGDLRP